MTTTGRPRPAYAHGRRRPPSAGNRRWRGLGRAAAAAALALCAGLTAACRTPAAHRAEADAVAHRIVQAKQLEAVGRAEPFTIDAPSEQLRARLLLDQKLPHADAASLGARHVTPIEQWPDASYLEPDPETTQPSAAGPLHLTLLEALQVGARNSREYQQNKERVFEEALRLDLERDAFRDTWAGVLDALASADSSGGADTQAGLEQTGALQWSRQLANGVGFTAGLGVELVRLLTNDGATTKGLHADATVSIPLLRGSGAFVVTEPLTQAERDVVYAIYEFERFKRTFAVEVASAYLGVLQQADQVENAADNYGRLIASTRRARRLADVGTLPEIQVDQARQDELRARDRWIGAMQSHQDRLDGFKILLGLPTDASVVLDEGELSRLGDRARRVLATGSAAEEAGPVPPADAPVVLAEPDRTDRGPLELNEQVAIATAFAHRLDLRVTVGRVLDGQRSVAVAADQLRADLTLLGTASMGSRRSIGSAGQPDADFRLDEGTYTALLTLDLPLERTAERNRYRTSLIRFEQAVRGVQALEDRIKLEVRGNLRDLLEARESARIQMQSVEVAARRVTSTNLFLQAGRAQIRDVLDAQESLVSAQDSLTSALVAYRISELQLQRDLGVLAVDERGLWQEYRP